MKRLGIMGCGSVADFGHLPAILDTPGVELAGCFDPDPARLEHVRRRFGATNTTTDPERLFDFGLDGIIVASPPAAHRANVDLAARHGVHVLCEKPLAPNEAESVALATAAREGGIQLYTAFVYRFSPVSLQIRQWVREGVVGVVRSLRLTYVWNLHGRFEQTPDGAWVESPRWRGRMLEGGPLVDCGVHQIDLARWWLESEVQSWTASGAWVAEYEAPDHVCLHMTHANGAHTTVEVSFSYGHTAREPLSLFSYHLIGTGGVIRYERDGYLLEARHGQGTLSVPGASEKNFHGMIAAFRDALEGGRPEVLASPEDGIVATRIARSATDALIDQRAGSSGILRHK